VPVSTRRKSLAAAGVKRRCWWRLLPRCSAAAAACAAAAVVVRMGGAGPSGHGQVAAEREAGRHPLWVTTFPTFSGVLAEGRLQAKCSQRPLVKPQLPQHYFRSWGDAHNVAQVDAACPLRHHVGATATPPWMAAKPE